MRVDGGDCVVVSGGGRSSGVADGGGGGSGVIKARKRKGRRIALLRCPRHSPPKTMTSTCFFDSGL